MFFRDCYCYQSQHCFIAKSLSVLFMKFWAQLACKTFSLLPPTSYQAFYHFSLPFYITALSNLYWPMVVSFQLWSETVLAKQFGDGQCFVMLFLSIFHCDVSHIKSRLPLLLFFLQKTGAQEFESLADKQKIIVTGLFLSTKMLHYPQHVRTVCHSDNVRLRVTLRLNISEISMIVPRFWGVTIRVFYIRVVFGKKSRMLMSFTLKFWEQMINCNIPNFSTTNMVLWKCEYLKWKI